MGHFKNCMNSGKISLDKCVCVCVCVCVCEDIHNTLDLRVCVCVCVCVLARKWCVCVCVCLCVCIYVFVCMCMYVCMCLHSRYMCVFSTCSIQKKLCHWLSLLSTTDMNLSTYFQTHYLILWWINLLCIVLYIPTISTWIWKCTYLSVMCKKKKKKFLALVQMYYRCEQRTVHSTSIVIHACIHSTCLNLSIMWFLIQVLICFAIYGY